MAGEEFIVLAIFFMIADMPLLLIPLFMRWPWWTFVIFAMISGETKKKKRRREEEEEREPEGTQT